MSISDVVRKLAVPIGVPLGLFTFYNAIINLTFHHGPPEETEKQFSMKKLDGLFSHTSFQVDKENATLHVGKWGRLFFHGYRDDGADGEVDGIYRSLLVPYLKPKVFERERDYWKHKEMFDKASRDVRRDIKRFAPHMSRSNRHY